MGGLIRARPSSGPDRLTLALGNGVAGVDAGVTAELAAESAVTKLAAAARLARVFLGAAVLDLELDGQAEAARDGGVKHGDAP